MQNISFTVRDVAIGNGMHIHTAEYKHTGPHRSAPAHSDGTDQLPLVAMHGFGTGLGIYYAALPALAERWRGPLFAIDTLGCGMSSRPRWHLPKGATCDVAEAEAFFIDGLECWRKSMSIERMVLMGHSAGGYLAVAYAEKYPMHVERLILVSSVGVPHPPKQLAEVHREAPLPVRLVLYGWKSGISPFTIAKMGLGHSLLRRYVEMRFADASWVAKTALEAYLHGIWTGGANSAGGYALSTLLSPGGIGELAYARHPQGAERIPALRVGRIAALYGDHDWMDWHNMEDVRKDIKMRGHGPHIDIMHISNASHNLQVDNPLGFVDAVLETCNADRSVHQRVYGLEYIKNDLLL